MTASSRPCRSATISAAIDNQAGATILMNNTPARYRRWLEAALAWTRQHQPPKRQVVFINAWNEWAEGNHLEPDTMNGHAYLEATRDALRPGR